VIYSSNQVKNPISWILINTFPLKRLQPNKPNPWIDNKRLVGTLGVDVIFPTLFYDTCCELIVGKSDYCNRFVTDVVAVL
jgi:hypothetical protein